MDDLPGWGNAAAVMLSCPGPLRRHQAALLPMDQVSLPQVLLGAESQVLAFAAAAESLAGRLFFAPFPEMFPDAASLRAAWRRVGGTPGGPASGAGRLAHLRFGGVRAARVLKGVRNGCVVAEAGGAAPLTASHHPFASGAVLPAAISRLFVYRPDTQARRPDGSPIPRGRLSPDCVVADLSAGLPSGAPDGETGLAGLDIVSLADFRSFAWAAGLVRPRGAPPPPEGGAPAVLLPWNMDHPGSIVPDLLVRLARLQGSRDATHTMPRVILLPFNYIGQTGIIRHLIGRLREAAEDPDRLLAGLFLARIFRLEGVHSLRALAPRAWVDGNDPEHWWTLARLSACGIAPILIDPATEKPPAGGARVAADEPVRVQADTRCGTLTFAAGLPPLRALPELLALTAAPGLERRPKPHGRAVRQTGRPRSVPASQPA